MNEHHRKREAFLLVETMARDMRYAVRTLRKRPGFAATCIATLALAIAANTTIFSVLNAVLLRSLPYRSPEQLAMLWIGTPGQNVQQRPAYVTVEEWRRQSKSFADIAVFDSVTLTLTRTDGAERISAARISPNFFALLGIQPIQGRVFSDQEADERQRLAVISDRFWRTHFGGSSAALGASIELDGRPSRVIGVLPPFLELRRLNADVWEPHTLFADWEARRRTRDTGTWLVVGRLRPNVTVEKAQAEMSGMARVLDSELPAAERNRGVTVVPLSVEAVGPGSRLALWLLTASALCVLLIAATNVASLSLARSVGRAREMAIRAALGAGRFQIVVQLLAESVTLAVISGALGSLLALAGVRFVQAFGPRDLARLDEASLDLRVLGWTFTLSLLTGILVGLAPAIALFRRKLRLLDADSGRSVSGGATSRRIHRALVVAEVAVAIILMAGAGLLIRSWRQVVSVDPGFRAERVFSMNIATGAIVPSKQRVGFYAAVLEQVESVPGVESAGMIGDLFVSSASERVVTTEGSAESLSVRLRMDEVSERLFATLRTPLLAGRFFSTEDGPDSPPVAIINDAMARRLWPGQDPVGGKFKFGRGNSDGRWMTVVGVVGDMHRQGLEIEPIPQVFVPLAQEPSGSEILFVRTSTDDPLAMVASVKAAVHRVESKVPLYSVASLEERLERYLTQRRFQTFVMIGFSAVALLMAAIGIYGLIHYSVASRAQEIGARMALGARGSQIFRMVIREGLQLSAIGLLLGLLGAFWTGRAGSSLLFGVTATDPLTFTTISLFFIAVTVAACYFPARRAMKVDPVVVLRQE